jgi:hypothetical protein
MILNIILVIILCKLSIDLFIQREGMDIEPPSLNIRDCDYDVNIIFPYYDISHNIHTDRNNFIYHSYQNIKKYASKPCVPRK